MKYHELTLTKSKKKSRKGRGIAAGQGKTAGRGTKGQGARSGGGVRPGFEGGQNPLMQRLPKAPGFRSLRAKAENVYTDELEAVGAVADNFSLFDAGLVSSPYVRVKLILRGEIKKAVKVALQGASAQSIAMVQKAGGTFTVTPQVKRTAKTSSEDADK